MGIIARQAFPNSINIIFGFIAGAINTIIVLPLAFEDTLDDWGFLKIIISFSLILSSIFGLGVNNIIIKEYLGTKDESQTKSILGFSIILALFGSFLLTAFIALNGLDLFINTRDAVLIKENILSLLLLSISLTLSQVFTGFITAKHKTPIILFMNDAFLKVSYLCLALTYLFYPFSFSLFVGLFVGTYVITLLFYFFYSISIGFLPKFRFKELDIKGIINYGVYTVLDRGAAIIVSNLDLIMIAYLLHLSDVAVYGLAFFIAVVVLIPQKAIMTPSLPLVSELVKNNKLAELKKLYFQSSINQLIIGGALFVFIWTGIDQVFELIPEIFSEGKWVVFYIGLSRLFLLSSGISGAIIIFSKYYRINLVFNLFLIGLTIATNYFLITKYQITGAAIATAITFLLYNLLKIVYIKFRFKMQPFTIETVKSILVLTIVGVIGSNLDIFSANPLLSIIVKSSIIAILLALGFYGLRVKAEILDVPRKLIKK